MSHDPAASRRFHERLLGWTSEEAPHAYAVFGLDGERAVESGGRVVEAAHDVEEGRFAVLEDPAGAAFGIFEGHVSQTLFARGKRRGTRMNGPCHRRS